MVVVGHFCNTVQQVMEFSNNTLFFVFVDLRSAQAVSRPIILNDFVFGRCNRTGNEHELQFNFIYNMYDDELILQKHSSYDHRVTGPAVTEVS